MQTLINRNFVRSVIFLILVTIFTENQVFPASLTVEPVFSSGHAGKVMSVCFSPDGRLLASGGMDNTVKIWDLRTGLELKTINGHSNQVTDVAFTPDGTHLITRANDDAVKLWDVQTGKPLAASGDSGRNAEYSNLSVLRNSNTTVSTFVNGFVQIRLLDTKTLKKVKDITYATSDNPWGSLEVLATSPTGSFFAAGSNGFVWLPRPSNVARGQNFRSQRLTVRVAIYPVATTQNPKILDCPNIDGTPHSLSISADGSLVAAGIGMSKPYELTDLSRQCGGIVVWDVQSGKVLQEIRLPDCSAVDAVRFSPSGTVLAAASSDGQLRILDASSGKDLRLMRLNTSRIFSLDWNPDGTLIASGHEDGAIRIWQADSLEESRVMQNNAPKQSVSFNRVGDLLAAGTRRAIQVIDVYRARTLHVLTGLKGEVTCLAFSPDGDVLASGTTTAEVRLWNARTGKVLADLTKHEYPVRSLAFSPDGHWLVTVASKGEKGSEIIQWDAVKGQFSRMLAKQDKFNIWDRVAYLADGSIVVTTFRGISCFACDKEGREIKRLPWFVRGSPIAIAQGMVISQNAYGKGNGNEMVLAKKLKSGNERNSTNIIDQFKSVANMINDEFSEKTILKTAYRNPLRSVCFFPNGRQIAVGDTNGALTIIDCDGKSLDSLTRHRDAVNEISINPAGDLLVSASEDGLLKLWNVSDTGKLKELVSIVALGEEEIAEITPDGYYFATKTSLKNMGFRLGDTIYPFDQFDLKFNRPDIVLTRLQKSPKELIDAYYRASQRRLKKFGLTEDSVLANAEMPTIRVQSNDVNTVIKTRRVTFKVIASDPAYPLTRLLVYVNGVSAFGSAGLDLAGGRGQTIEKDVSVDLSAGPNKIQTSVLNEKGVESMREVFYITYNGSIQPAHLYIVAMGVSDYVDGDYRLKYAAKDAKDMAATIATLAQGKFQSIEPLLLLDRQVTREGIRSAKEFLNKATIDDEVIVFAAGHGLLDEKLDYYFGTADMDFDHPENKGLPYSELEGLVDEIAPRRKLLMIDTCHSGEVIPDEIAQAIPGSGAGTVRINPARGLAVKSANREPVHSTHGDSYAIAAMHFADLQRGSGAAVISAAGGAEYAYESPDWNNGVFSYSVITGLKSNKADLNGDGRITVSELKDFVTERVKSLTSGQQTPTARRENIESNFVVLGTTSQ